MELKVLIPEKNIKKRVEELALQISEEFSGESVTVVALLKGAFVFTADLIRLMKSEAKVDFLRVKSYLNDKKGNTEVTYLPQRELIEGENVLIVDDIFDTGESLEVAYRLVAEMSPAKVKTCVLLNKEMEKRTLLTPDFVGFTIPNIFVFGYGLDYNEMYRDLPYIGYFEKGV